MLSAPFYYGEYLGCKLLGLVPKCREAFYSLMIRGEGMVDSLCVPPDVILGVLHYLFFQLEEVRQLIVGRRLLGATSALSCGIIGGLARSLPPMLGWPDFRTSSPHACLVSHPHSAHGSGISSCSCSCTGDSCFSSDSCCICDICCACPNSVQFLLPALVSDS